MGLACQDTASFNDIDAQTDQTGLKIALDAVGEVLGVCRNTLPVVFDFSYLNSERFEVLGVLHLTHTSRRGQECLAWHTATVDTSTTNISTGKDSRLEILRTRMQGRPVSANTTANNGDIKVIRSFTHGEFGEIQSRW